MKRHSHNQFMPLSDLAHPPITAKDLAPLVPATLVSVLLNTALVVSIIWYQSGSARAGDIAKVTLDEETSLESRKEKEFIDIDTGVTAVDPTSESVESSMQIPGEVLPAPMVETPPAPERTEAGSGGEADSGFAGIGETPGALPGTFIDKATPGFKGDEGFGPLGEGGGFGGLGGGTMKPGGFGDRTGDLLNKARSRGGNDASENAVANGMRWLALHQAPDGRWSLDRYHAHARGCNCRELIVERGVQPNDTGATAMALLPFLGAGQTHKRGSFSKNIHAGLRFLIGRQDPRGNLQGGLYAHGLATIALCEAYGMTSDPVLRSHAQRALQFIGYAQKPAFGGWDYTPRSSGARTDMSVTGWQIMALKSGQLAGLDVPAAVMDGAKRCLNSHASEGGSQYSYTPGVSATPSMIAAGLLCRQYLGWGLRTPELHKGCKFLLQDALLPPDKPPASGTEKLGPIYYYYYASQVMHHMGGEYFEKWNPRIRDFLIRTQEKTGHRAGSWDPDGSDWGIHAGRIYSTSMALMTLEVYYRHLPLYRRGDVMGDQNAEAERKPESQNQPPPPQKEPEQKEPPKKEPEKKESPKG